MTGGAVADAEALRAQLHARLQALYADLAAGRDVAPARRFRLEGALELALQAGLLTRGLLGDWLAAAGVHGEEHAAALADSPPRLPVAMAVAPVRASTSSTSAAD